MIAKIHRLLPELDGKRVLVVDDDPDARAMLGRMLKEEHAEIVLARPEDDLAHPGRTAERRHEDPVAIAERGLHAAARDRDATEHPGA